MCYADDTPMPVLRYGNKLGDQQVRTCRNWDKFVQWAAAPERSACHKTLDDYLISVNEIERWQYCSDDSPFKAAKERYFEKFGHKNVFGP